jgi:hypothetical protein
VRTHHAGGQARAARWLLAALALAVGAPATHASHVGLDRTPGAYFALALRKARYKNLALTNPGCNLGVNCSGSGACGTLQVSGGRIGEPGQLAGGKLRASGTFFQVFRNDTPGASPDCSMIEDPGSRPDCADTLVAPIIEDLDGDLQPSCDAACTQDPGDIAIACGVSLPLPACDPGRPVTVLEDGDCSIDDTIPGNSRCDLPAGSYGNVVLANGARIDFAPGTTVLCSLKARNAVRITTAGPATVIVPGKGVVKINNDADVGGDCDALRIVTDQGLLKLGRHGDYALDACALRGKLRLGRGNNLRGTFIGDFVLSDFNNDGRCCVDVMGPPITTTTTSTSTTTVPTTTPLPSSTVPGTTTTSAPTTTSPASTTTTTSTTIATTTTTTTLDPGTTTTLDPGTTTTSTTSTSTTTSSTTTSTTTTTGTTASTTSSTTTSSPSTTSTTLAAGDWTRSAGFYKNRPPILAAILTGAGGVDACGIHFDGIAIDACASALEALCIEVHGVHRRQLVRQLLTAALNMAAGGATYAGFAACDAVCQSPGATNDALSACIADADAYNMSGDNLMSPFDPAGPADPTACEAAFATACDVTEPATCAVCP